MLTFIRPPLYLLKAIRLSVLDVWNVGERNVLSRQVNTLFHLYHKTLKFRSIGAQISLNCSGLLQSFFAACGCRDEEEMIRGTVPTPQAKGWPPLAILLSG